MGPQMDSPGDGEPDGLDRHGPRPDRGRFLLHPLTLRARIPPRDHRGGDMVPGGLKAGGGERPGASCASSTVAGPGTSRGIASPSRTSCRSRPRGRGPRARAPRGRMHFADEIGISAASCPAPYLRRDRFSAPPGPWGSLVWARADLRSRPQEILPAWGAGDSGSNPDGPTGIPATDGLSAVHGLS